MAIKLSNSFWRSCACAALLCTVAPGSASAHPLKGDWAMLNFDAHGTRYNKYETPLNTDSAKTLHLLWQANIGDSGSSPAIVNGVVYAGTDDGHCYALDAATGATIWSTSVGSAAYSSPAVVNGVVYIGTIKGKFIALNAESGATLWAANLDNKTTQSPTVGQGRVFIGDDLGTTYGFDAQSGKLLWKASYPGGASMGAPAIANGLVYAQSESGRLHAYGAKTGVESWHADFSSGYGSAVTDGQRVFVYSHTVSAFDALTGNVAWSVALDHNENPGLALVKNRLFVANPQSDPFLWQFDADTGAALKTKQTSMGFGNAPTVANGVVFSAAGNRMLAYNAKSGRTLWSTQLGQAPTMSPVVSHGVVYAAAGSIYAFAPN